MSKYPIPTEEEIEQKIKDIEIDISKHNELRKKATDKSNYHEIINYLAGQRTAFLYVLGYTKDLM